MSMLLKLQIVNVCVLHHRAANERFSTLKRTKTDDTKPKLNVVCFVVQSCLIDADFVIPSTLLPVTSNALIETLTALIVLSEILRNLIWVIMLSVTVSLSKAVADTIIGEPSRYILSCDFCKTENRSLITASLKSAED